MVDITGKVDVKLEVTPEELGKIFASMYSDEQAEFFYGVYSVTKEWDKASCFQWQALRYDLEKVPEALKEFKEMAVYGPDNYGEEW